MREFVCKPSARLSLNEPFAAQEVVAEGEPIIGKEGEPKKNGEPYKTDYHGQRVRVTEDNIIAYLRIDQMVGQAEQDEALQEEWFDEWEPITTKKGKKEVPTGEYRVVLKDSLVVGKTKEGKYYTGE